MSILVCLSSGPGTEILEPVLAFVHERRVTLRPVTTQQEVAGHSQSRRTTQPSTAVADPPPKINPGRSLSPIKSKSLTIIRSSRIAWSLVETRIAERHFNLQTGRPVCMSFTLEGRGKHCTQPPCWGWVYLKKERPVCISFTFEGHGDHYPQVNYGVVLLLGVESLTVGSTTGVPMSPGPCPARCITKEPEYYIVIPFTHPQQRPICMSFTLESRGDHYENLSMRWCKVGSTTGLLMSSGHGGDQATAAKEYYTTPPPYYATKATYATST
ncbi:hypothetical protein DAPPUDRAFT_235833 [Daphnia pulex]|uniref:Uncharacterized protein n=1 Tax=Daphnia pulex TaxID=6669 RepID=E9G0Z6_DAPPU|nr:hypothetical protein DAPPUDRAFT_235833 [Daphnia pulex]|eukprot:EFX86994.1 hypothetical protein DAPPUDRAFT_235833 [Daphnia pulex]